MPGAALEFSEADWAAIEAEGCRRSLEDYTKTAWQYVQPGRRLVWNWHLSAICEHLQAVSEGEIKRLLINVPFRTGKSLLTGVFWPSWDWIDHATRQFLAVSYAQRLAKRDAVRTRRLMTTNWYQGHYGNRFQFAGDQNEKSKYENNVGGYRLSAGMNGGVMGDGADILLIDDPHDRQGAHSDVERPAALTTYDEALTTRLNDPKSSAIVVIMQRLHEEDLSGHILARESKDWVHLMLPMEFEIDRRCKTAIGFRDPRSKDGELLCPERVGPDELVSIKRNIGEYASAGQLQQKPVPDGGGIIKKHWWRKWDAKKPLPVAIHTFASVDTAFSEKDHEDAAYSARTCWIVFEDEETKLPALLLAKAWYERVGYPVLRKTIRDKHIEDRIDTTLIEYKASGISLVQDLRRIRKPRLSIRTFKPGRLSKVERAHLASTMFEAGLVYYVDSKEWAQKVVDLVASFPAGAAPGPDITDTVTQAVLYTKQRGWAKAPDEESDALMAQDVTEEEQEDHDDGAHRRAVYG